MKYFLLTVIFLSLLKTNSAVTKHMKHHSTESTKQEISEKKHKLPHHAKYDICSDNADYVIFCDHKVHKNILFFKEIEFMSCFDFLETAINDFYLCDDKEAMKKHLLTLSPQDLWHIFHDQEQFNYHLGFFLDKIFTKSEFVILYEARLAIELLLFALDHTGKIQYPYAHNRTISLKEVMKKLLLYTQEKESTFGELLPQKDIINLKKFFQKYSEVSNNLTFLSELQELVKVLKVIGIEPGEAAGARRKMSIYARFSKFF
jgi:hypothetical protein